MRRQPAPGVVPEFAATGGVFVISAVESLSDVVLANLEKGHSREDVPVALEIVRRAGIALRPSFVPFTPWATLDDYLELLDFVEAADLIERNGSRPAPVGDRAARRPGALL